jgi:hypothetical protein
MGRAKQCVGTASSSTQRQLSTTQSLRDLCVGGHFFIAAIKFQSTGSRALRVDPRLKSGDVESMS